MKLIRGNANSSWSLRPWLCLKHADIPFEEHVIQLGLPDTSARIREHSPSGQVPMLIDGSVRVWESLAICEYVAELRPAAGLWPADPEARALARSVSAEMHAGFQALRTSLPLQFSLQFPLPAKLDSFAAAVRNDIARIGEIWQDCRRRFGASGPFLFGTFTIADAMFAPVVSRFRTYNVPLDTTNQSYSDTLWSLPTMQEWLSEARREWT
jgi:glutathione S-transferase